MLLMDKLNLNHLRVFESVHRLLSMTKAAKELHLTQSGVSQHVKALEESLDLVLFNRVNHKVVPTAVANTLADKCRLGFSELEKTLWILTKQENELVGRIKVSMPDEFGHNVLVPMIGDFLKSYPEVQCELHFGMADDVNSGVKSGLFDFGFVDGYSVDKTLKVTKVTEENFQLLASKKYAEKYGKIKNNFDYLSELEYIAYLPGEPVLKMWATEMLSIKDPRFQVKAYCKTPSSILKLILNDNGVGILPIHILNTLSKTLRNKLVSLHSSKKMFRNPVSMVILPIRSQSRPAAALEEYLIERLACRPPSTPID